jgi:hypothetical protein
MNSEMDRRWRLIERTHEQCQVAIEQRDESEIMHLMSHQLRLIVTQCQACELVEPGFIAWLLQSKDAMQVWADLGITDKGLIEAVYRGQVDPWSRRDDQ